VYFVVIVTTMLIAPVVSIMANVSATPADNLPFLAAKWFVFWALGIRLLMAGVRQVIQPSFTAPSIFRIDDPGAAKLVSEIGFANVAISAIAIASLFLPGWLAPAGTAGALFLGLAGVQHAKNCGRTAKESIAMVSDLAVAATVIVALLAANFR
jgi:hypothetical protein